ncbi:MAG: XkdF-like putative serine protease domain-containing protein [Pseudomonadota bacterium]
MPIPIPGKNEKQEAFMTRCMSAEMMQREYPEQEQRTAVCMTQWRDAHDEARKAAVVLVRAIPAKPLLFDERMDMVAPIVCADDEKRLVYGLVYAPDDEDTHGDSADADEIEAAAHGFMASRVVGLQHKAKAPASVVESYIAQADMPLGKEQIKKGSWLVVLKIEDDNLWKAVKDGTFDGISMGGSARRVKE